MARMSGYNPQPGMQSPQKYSFVGSNYKQYGEQAGFIYDPYTDQYYRDPRSTYEQYKKEGLITEPKKQTLAGSLMPVGLAAGTVALATEGGKAIPGAVKGLLGLGAKEGAANAGTSLGSSVGVGATGGAGPSSGVLDFAGSPLVSEGGYTLGGGAAGEGAALTGTPSTSLASYSPYLGLVGAGVGGYELHKGIQAGDRKTSAMGGAALGGGLAAAAPLLGLGPVGLLGIGAAALGGGVLGGLAGHIGGGKSKAQKARDKSRGALMGLGVADKESQVSLADGSKFNIGIDGHARLQNVGQNIDGKTERQYWDVDFSNPLASDAVNAVKSRVVQIVQDPTQQDQLTGMLVNAATSNAKSKEEVAANIEAIFKGYQQQPTGQSQQTIVQDNAGSSPSVQNTENVADPNTQTADITQSAALKALLRKGALKKLGE